MSKLSEYDIEAVKRRRIIITIHAYAYEVMGESYISDSEYDMLSILIAKTIDTETGNKIYDEFFREQFDSSTGMWVRKHPDLNNGKLHSLYNRYKQCVG